MRSDRSHQDLFEEESIFSLMPRTFIGFGKSDSLDPLDVEAVHNILQQQNLCKVSDKDLREAKVVLSLSNTSSDLTEVQKAGKMETQIPNSMKMDNLSEIFKENIPPDNLFPFQRSKREGTGRMSSRRRFSVSSSALDPILHVPKQPKNLEDVAEFFEDAERREEAEAILRKMKGEESPKPNSYQPLRTRARRKGTGRKIASKGFDWQLSQNATSYIEVDKEKLVIEEEENSLATFISSSKQHNELNDGSKINDGKRQADCCSAKVDQEPLKAPSCNDVQQMADCNLSFAPPETSLSHGLINNVEVFPNESAECIDDSSLKPDLVQLERDFLPTVTQTTDSCENSTIDKFHLAELRCISPSNNDASNNVILESCTGDINNSEGLADSLKMSGVSSPNKKIEFPEVPEQFENFIHENSLEPPETSTHCNLATENSPAAGKASLYNMNDKQRESRSPSSSPTPSPSKFLAAMSLLDHQMKAREVARHNDNRSPSVCNSRENIILSSPKEKSPKRGKQKLNFDCFGLQKAVGTLEKADNCTNSGENVVSSRLDKPCSRRKKEKMSPDHHFVTEGPVDTARENNLSSMHVYKPVESTRPSPGKKPSSRKEVQNLPCSTEVQEHDDTMGQSSSIIFTALQSSQKCNLIEPSGSCANESQPSERVGLKDEDMLSQRNLETHNDSTLNSENENVITDTSPFVSAPIAIASASTPSTSILEQHTEGSSERSLGRKSKKARLLSQKQEGASSSDCPQNDEEIVIKEVKDGTKIQKKKKFQHRQSLAGAGTLWKSGVRRSTRIKSRPLEYWRGERFLYGRIHESLATVIGIKYTSPIRSVQKSNKVPTFKVQSFVDDRYSELVQLAAKH